MPNATVINIVLSRVEFRHWPAENLAVAGL